MFNQPCHAGTMVSCYVRALWAQWLTTCALSDRVSGGL